jgi:hypothetical protein
VSEPGDDTELPISRRCRVGLPAASAARHATMTIVPFVSHPLPPHDPALDRVTAVLDPILTTLGFAAGQAGASGGRGQVIFCRGLVDSTDGACVDLVVDLEATPEWRITDVRYWGYPSDRWHLAFDRDSDLPAQLSGLARTLPNELS